MNRLLAVFDATVLSLGRGLVDLRGCTSDDTGDFAADEGVAWR